MDSLDAGDYQDKFSDYYSFVSVIGKGAFGTVVHALDKYSGEEVAVKVILKQSLKPEYIGRLRQEAELLASLVHPNVVGFKHMKETQTRMFLVMEMVYGTNLQTFLRTQQVSEATAKKIFIQLLEGIRYIHSRHVVHRDIKPANILVTNEPVVKIIDFGLSTALAKHQLMESGKCGTLLFMAPEQRLSPYYSKEVDVWSAGIVLYMLLAQGRHPLSEPNESTLSFLEKLKQPLWEFPESFPAKAKSLFLRMVRQAPMERYTASQALKHPWTTNLDTTVPKTIFEEMQEYSDQLKLKVILYSLLFGCKFRPQQQQRPRPPLVIIKRHSREIAKAEPRTPARKRTVVRVVSSSLKRAPLPVLRHNRSSRRNLYVSVTPLKC